GSRGRPRLAAGRRLALRLDPLEFLLCRMLRDHALRRDLRPRCPDDGVEHHPAKVFELPVVEEMTAREAEAAPAVLALDGPGHDLLVPLVGNGGRENWRQPRVAFAKADVVVILLAQFERLEAATDGVARGSGQRPRLGRLDLRVP